MHDMLDQIDYEYLLEFPIEVIILKLYMQKKNPKKVYLNKESI